MRKYVIGILIGAGLTFALQAGAASLLGSTIDAVIQVEVDGENLGQAPVIDGVSYLPVRKFGSKAGYNVSFEEGKATLASEAPLTTTAVPVVAEPITDLTIPEVVAPATAEAQPFTIEGIELSIKVATEQISFLKYAISSAETRGYANDPEVLKMKESLSVKEKELEVWNERKTKLQTTP